MVTAETKIFSVAVQAGKTEGSASRNPPLRDVEGQMVDRPVILNTRNTVRERHCSDDEFKPAQREAVEEPEVEAVPEETIIVEEDGKDKVQEEQPVMETKKQKKNKKKGKNPEPMTCSSADEMKEVEVKPKKKKNKKEKTPEPELIVHRPDETKTKPVVEDIVEVAPKEKTETEEIFEEFVVKDEISYPEDFSPDKDLVEFSETEDKVVEIEEDPDDSEKVDFFIREKSSSVESDDLRMSSTVDETAAKPNPWFNKFLQKSSSLIEDQIFGAAKKYEDKDEEKMDEDDDMMELEMNQTNVETNIAALLEDDEVVTEEPKSERTSSSLPMILQLDPKQSALKTPADIYSSDDDLQFQPVPNKRNKKKGKQQQQKFNDDFDTQDSCPADSESEKFSEYEDTHSSRSKGKDSKDGWSFEMDEEDVNKMLESDNVKEVTADTEERTALEDVFRLFYS